MTDDEWELPEPDPQFVPQWWIDQLAQTRAVERDAFPVTWDEDR